MYLLSCNKINKEKLFLVHFSKTCFVTLGLKFKYNNRGTNHLKKYLKLQKNEDCIYAIKIKQK